MKEKLLAMLITAFAGVDKAILERIATKKTDGIEDESLLQTIADGVTTMDIINSESDRRTSMAAESVKTKTIAEYEAIHNLKNGKAIVATPPATIPPDPKESPQIAALTKQIQDLTGLVSGVVQTQSVAEKRASSKVLFESTKIPKNRIQTYLDRLVYDSETSLEDQIKGFETEYLDFKQEFINESIANGNYIPGESKKVADNEKDWIDIHNGDGDSESSQTVKLDI